MSHAGVPRGRAGDLGRVIRNNDAVEVIGLENPDNPFYPSNYGLILSYLGDCEQALELGRKGKELLSADECHW